MPNYKDSDNKLHFIDDAQYEHLLPAGCVAITDAEAEVIRVAQTQTVAPAPITLTALQFLRGLSQIILPPRETPFITVEEARNRSVIPVALVPAFNALPEPYRGDAEIVWANMTSVSRNEPLVAFAGSALELSSAEIDAFFAAAATL